MDGPPPHGALRLVGYATVNAHAYLPRRLHLPPLPPRAPLLAQHTFAALPLTCFSAVGWLVLRRLRTPLHCRINCLRSSARMSSAHLVFLAAHCWFGLRFVTLRKTPAVRYRVCSTNTLTPRSHHRSTADLLLPALHPTRTTRYLPRFVATGLSTFYIPRCTRSRASYAHERFLSNTACR